MAGTLGSLQIMEKNLNIEMGRGERAGEIRLCRSSFKSLQQQGTSRASPRGRQSAVGFQGGACARARGEGEGEPSPEAVHADARVSQSLASRQQHRALAKFAASKQCSYHTGIPGSHLLAQEAF